MASHLLTLPHELITTIFEHIEDPADLIALTQCSSRLQPLAESVYYRHLLHRSGEEAIKLDKAVAERPERAQYILSIDSRCKWRKRAGLAALAPVIAQATNLRELTLESPYCNNAFKDGEKELTEWRSTRSELVRPVCVENGLMNLRRLTLHLSDTPRYWLVGEDVASLFAHPTLFDLTISCAELQEDCLRGIQGRPKTPLRKLTFIECDIELEALQIILSLPRALEELYLGENVYHQWLNTVQFRPEERTDVSQLCKTDPKVFFQALSQQKHSLQTLSYAVRAPETSTITLPSSCKGLSEFYELRHVTLDGYCVYFEKAMSLPHTAPPHLISLTAKGDMFRLQCAPNLSLTDDYQSQVGWTIAYADLGTRLERVRIASSRTFTNISRNHREAVEKLGKAFRDLDIHMCLAKRTFHRNIPPFLYGEQEYKEELVYDSDEGFARAFGSSGDREADDIDF